MTKEKVCPLCDSDLITATEHIEELCEPFGGCKEVALTYDRCERCGTEGDFANTNDALIQKAENVLKSQAIQSILRDFSNEKINFAGMERALNLPQRTLTKWKSGHTLPSAAGVALLRFMRLFPWMLMVAEQKFDYEDAQRIHMKDALNKFVSQMPFHESIAAGNNLTLNFHFHQSESDTMSFPTDSSSGQLLKVV